MTARVSAEGIERLVELACGWTGFTRGAIRPEAIERVAAAQLGQGCSEQQLLELASARHPELVRAFLQVISVGETYFFRHPEHFSLLASVLQERPAGRPLRAWSAGCSTGEETYSLAACLRAHAPGEVEVVGTDLLERNLEVARAGRYGAWSVRESGPILYPVFVRDGAKQVWVTDQVRSLVRFERHNLLDGPPGAPGTFDIVFCRNVLVYFSAEAAQAASSAIMSALVPGGLAVFGPMDLLATPAGLSRYQDQLTVFRLEHKDLATKSLPRPVQRPRPSAPPVPERSRAVALTPARHQANPVEVHLRALLLVERGELREARVLLERLAGEVPEYLPGVVERALLCRRLGDWNVATELMREALRLTKGAPAEQVVAGPEVLPVSYYRATAELFLEGQQQLERS